MTATLPASPGAAAPCAVSGDVRAFRVACALLAAYVADDAFLHPERGVSAGDHVVSGLVPLALLLACALAYPRLRAGGRALLAGATGLLAIVSGITDGIRHVVLDRLAGDDGLAILAALTGAFLLALAGRLLWRSRRTGGPRGRRYARRAAHGLAGLVVLWLAVVPAAMAILATHKARAPVPAADLGTAHQRVSLRTGDGLTLAGWYVPSRNGAAVIAFPGRSGPVPHARLLARHGYGVLLLDRRGEGESEGDINLYGWGGEEDVLAAIAFLRQRSDVDPGRIGGLGLSVGGELLLATAARTGELRAVVAEGAGERSLAEHLHRPGTGGVQRWLTPWVAQTAALAVLSNTSPPDDLLSVMPRTAPRPVLLIQAIHGAGGEDLNPAYAAAGGTSTSLWQVADGGHTGALPARPAEYERRVIGFLDRALLR